ncbi:tape measure protein [Erwinia sp. ACCC 02193]|uniref:Tape measure protein n=1 Tax=Erwinia aeris TaxID=3239803 RepID=A0ABV4E2C1_9GAMM
MASDNQVGSLVYEVEMNVARLLDGQRQVNDRLDKMESGFERTGKAVDSAEKSFSSLSRVAVALSAAISVTQVAEYGNAWVTVNNKLANSLRATEQLADVTQRVFDISQDTRSSLEATATLYGRLERSTRAAGTSTADLIKLTTTINKGLAVSGATTEEASSTMTQLSQALASGVLRGEEFNSISENGSRLAVALADSLGVTIGQLRGMAAQGKLTTEVVVNGLLKQSDAIAKEFSNTALTMGQAFTVATNNITKFVGESSSVQSTINVFNSGVISLSENLNAVSGVVTVLAGIMGSRFVGALTMATAAKISAVAASRQQTIAENQAAQAALSSAAATTRRSFADKEAAISAMNLAQAEYNVARGSSAEGLALDNLTAKKSASRLASLSLAEAELAQAAATTRAAAASSAASTGMATLRGALALVGGPAGAAMLAGAAIFYFYQKAQQAKQESIDFADKLDGVISKMKEMSQTQLGAEIAKAEQSIIDQKDAITGLRGELSALEEKKTFIEQAASIRGAAAVAEDYQQVQRDIAIQAGKVDSAEGKLSQTVSKTGLMRAQLNGTLAQGIDLLKRDSDQAGVAAGLMNQFGNALDFASKAKDKFNSTSLQLPRSDKADAYNKDLADENTLLAITDKRLRAVTKARMEAADKGGNQNQVNAAGQLAGAQYDLQQAEIARNKETKAGIAEGKKAATQAENIAQKLANLKQQSELAGDSTRELSRDQAILTAQQSLGSAATQSDIKLAGQYAAAKWDTGNAIRAQAAAEKLLPEAKENASYKQDVADLQTAFSAKKISQQQFNATSEKLEQEHQVNLAKIRAETSAGISPLQDAQGAIDPVQALANENARKLALIQEFETEKSAITANGLALMNAANTEYEQARIDAAWKIWENQNQTNQLLGGAIDSLQGGATNAITGLINGTQSLQESLANIGSTILNSVVSGLVEMGLQYVKNMIVGQAAAAAALAATTAQATAAAAAWAPAAISASIATLGSASTVGTAAYSTALTASSGLAIAGARKNGGPVTAGSMYQVGENGMPEIYQASTGKQYMIPGDNGKVISNKDLSGSAGGGSVIQQEVNFHITTTGGIDNATMQKMAAMMKTVSLNTIKDQQRPRGLLSKG